jgi:hypothetical protein
MYGFSRRGCVRDLQSSELFPTIQVQDRKMQCFCWGKTCPRKMNGLLAVRLGNHFLENLDVTQRLQPFPHHFNFFVAERIGQLLALMH